MRRDTKNPMAEAPPAQIQFRCHACRQKFAVKVTRVGSKFKCPKCEAVLQVPARDALDRPEASKPKVRIQQAVVKSKGTTGADSINHLSISDVGAMSGSVSTAVASVESDQTPKTPPPPAPAAADKPKPPAVIPPGKKACPECAHVCPGMALSCPMCYHRFEIAKPKPAADSAFGTPASAKTKGDSSAGSKAGVSLDPQAEAKAKAQSRVAEALKQKQKDLGKQLDSAITVRGKGVGRPVEPPLWMDEAIYGRAFKLGGTGLFCMTAAILIFVQLDSAQSAKNAFILIQWLYAIGGRWVPSLLCFGFGLFLLSLAIIPVVKRIQYERQLNTPQDPFENPS